LIKCISLDLFKLFHNKAFSFKKGSIFIRWHLLLSSKQIELPDGLRPHFPVRDRLRGLLKRMLIGSKGL
jgi:hypothetical protein